MAAFLTLLLMALAFCLIGALLLALTVGFGFLLKTIFSSLESGPAIIAGSIVGVATVHFFWRLMQAVISQTEDAEGIPEDHPILVLPKDFLQHLPGRTRRSRKDK